MNFNNDNLIYNLKLQSLGQVAPLNIFYRDNLMETLKDPSLDWKPYNRTKENFNRFGLSLTSLKGEVDGVIDLNSLKEHNRVNGTSYDEMSFRTPTAYWDKLSSLTAPVSMFKPHLGRSHLLRLDVGGFFPPHRDIGDSFRLISFLHTSPTDCVFLVDDKKVFFEPDRFYYVNTCLVHSLFSFVDNSYVLVFNVEPNMETVSLVFDHLEAQ